jgi:hypothetical protein
LRGCRFKEKSRLAAKIVHPFGKLRISLHYGHLRHQKASPKIEGAVVQDENVGLGPQENSNATSAVSEPGQECGATHPPPVSGAAHVRAARAKLIEETTYRLTDLFTIISGRIEILSEKVPEICRQELLAIRNVLARGVELNNRLYLAAQACRREIGRPLKTSEIIED